MYIVLVKVFGANSVEKCLLIYRELLSRLLHSVVIL